MSRKIRGTTITTPLARHAVTDDTCVSKKPWSSENIVDKLCPDINESGGIVTCEPVEGYPLTVTAEDGATTITRCGKNLLDLSEGKVDVVSYIDSTGNLNNDFYGVELILPPGTYTIKAVLKSGATGDYIYGAVNDIDKTHRIDTFSPVQNTSMKALTKTFNEWVRLYIYDAGVKISMGRKKEVSIAVLNKYDIQLEVGATATAFEPYVSESFNVGDAVPALSGVNTIWADTGNITVSGKADPVAIINKLTSAVIALGSI